MTFAEQIESYVPGKDNAVVEGIIKEMLAHCGDDFELKDIVSQSIRGLCITGTAKLRTMDQIKARIDAVRANLEEVRSAAAGNAANESAGVCLLSGLNGKSLPAGAIARMVKATTAEKAGEFANLSADSTPQQIAKAVAANFQEHKEFSKDSPAIYEAGKRMMTALRGKSLPPGMISKLFAEVANVKVDAIRRLSSKSSAIEIHRAVTQIRDNIMKAMEFSGAVMACGAISGAESGREIFNNEKEKCR